MELSIIFLPNEVISFPLVVTQAGLKRDGVSHAGPLLRTELIHLFIHAYAHYAV